MAVKRVHYFNHQLLREQDFNDEQAYHMEMRRRHNRLFHSWGVVDGLEVRQHGQHEVMVEPGMALDREGREIILLEGVKRNLSSFTHDDEVYVTVSYQEDAEESDRLSVGGREEFSRTAELAEIREQRKEHLEENALILARVRLNEHGHIEHVDTASPPRRIAREAVTNPNAGWLRLPFKPVRLNTLVIAGQPGGATETDFVVDEANAYCGERGAKGSMQIPVPPGVTRITGFKIAGTTEGEVRVRLLRTGWNEGKGEGEKTKLMEEIVTDASFHRQVSLTPTELNDSHALAVSVKAMGKTEIWLVAVKYE